MQILSLEPSNEPPGFRGPLKGRDVLYIFGFSPRPHRYFEAAVVLLLALRALLRRLKLRISHRNSFHISESLRLRPWKTSFKVLPRPHVLS